MKKEQIIIAGAVVLLALGAAFFGRTSSAPEDGNARLQKVLKARQVPVLVVVDGRGPQEMAFLRDARQAVAAIEGARLVHVDAQNPVEREVVARFPKNQLPLLLVVGLDGIPGYTKSSQVEPEAIKTAVAAGLTKPPIKIEEHVHSDGCGHNH